MLQNYVLRLTCRCGGCAGDEEAAGKEGKDSFVVRPDQTTNYLWSMCFDFDTEHQNGNVHAGSHTNKNTISYNLVRGQCWCALFDGIVVVFGF